MKPDGTDTTHYTGWRWHLAVIRKYWLYYAVWAVIAVVFVIRSIH